MGWVHCHKRCGARLALVALALQIVLSFGHVHLENVPLDGVRISHVAAAGAHNGVADNVVAVQASRHLPAQNPGNDDDYCAICASIFLASTSFVSQPPPLPVPVGFRRIEHSFGTSFDIIEPRRVAFRSRAPPAA
jgi:hypothetical protein